MSLPEHAVFYSSEENSGVAVSALDGIPGGKIDRTFFSGVWFCTGIMHSKVAVIRLAIDQACELAQTEGANGVVRFAPQLISEANGQWSASVTMVLVRWSIDLDAAPLGVHDIR